MPFDLTFDEPPLMQAREILSGERRSTLRRAIGDGSIERAATLPETDAAKEDSRDLIRLHENGLLEDLKHDWLAVPIIDLFEAIRTVANIDLSDDAAVGSRLRGETKHLVSRAEVVLELLQFIDLFEASVVHTLVRPAGACGLLLTRALVEWMTVETDRESVDRGNAFDAAAEELRNNQGMLCALPFSDRLLLAVQSPAALTAEQEIEFLVDVEYPKDAQRWIDVMRHLEAEHDLCELGSRQLRYLGPYQAQDPLWARNFFQQGLRLGQSAYPLLAHRAAYLAWQLIGRASAADESETLATIHALFDAESLWMIDSQDDYHAALARYKAGDKAAVVEAYGDLAEGTLRRYGSLVVALERIAVGEAVPEPLVLETIGEIEDQLGVWKSDPLPELILRFVERGLRNAGAHANVIVDVEQNLKVKQRDGTVETVIPDNAYGRTAGLRSILDGVDVAMNHASIRDTEEHLSDLRDAPMPPMSARMFERVVQQSAEVNTRGVVSGVRRDDEALTVTYHGPTATYEELKAFADSLMRLLGPVLPIIRILDENGDAIEIFRPPRRRDPVGRNDPCPCNSGKKYKRCHGA